MRAAPAPPAPAGVAPFLGPSSTSPEKGRLAPAEDPTGLPGICWRLWLAPRIGVSTGRPFPVSVCVQLCCTGPGAPLSAKGPLSMLFRRVRPQSV